MDRLFGLPAHPLVVHFPVVAIPVLAIAAVALVARPNLRARFGPALLALAVVTTVATFAAAASGEELSEILDADDYIDTHRTLGNQLRWIVLVLTLAVGGLVAMTRRAGISTAVANGTGLVVVLMAALALIWVVRTGHEGAKATWDGVLPSDEVDLAVADDPTTTSESPTTDSPTTDSPTTETPTTESTTTETATTEVPTTVETSTTDTTTVETTTALETTTSTDDDGSPDTSEAPASLGMAIYEANCQRCHRADGSGGRGPSLIGIAADQPDPQEQIDQIIIGGRGMPAFGERLTPEEIESVVDYIRAAFV